jgi:predicted transcriptional regulator
MSSRRGRIEVIKDILTEASSGASKTRIIYRANLNFSQFNRYFSELVKKGLIVWVNNPGGGVVYQTTEKGEALLEVLRKAEQFILL